MPLPRHDQYPIFRFTPNELDVWQPFDYPFNSFPPLECHVSPPPAVINGGPKNFNLDLDDIALTYHEQKRSQTQVETKQRLTLLRDIWDLIMGAKDDTKKWEESKNGKRKHMTLTGDVLTLLGKHHKSMDRIKEWVEATAQCWPE